MTPELNPTRLAFIDKPRATTNMGRTYGYAPAGERLVDATPHGHWSTTTVVAAPRADGFVARMVADGAD